jgi:hypothetical protein
MKISEPLSFNKRKNGSEKLEISFSLRNVKDLTIQMEPTIGILVL